MLMNILQVMCSVFTTASFAIEKQQNKMGHNLNVHKLRTLLINYSSSTPEHYLALSKKWNRSVYTH